MANQDKVTSIGTGTQPRQMMLVDAIQKQIQDIAIDHMTPIEVLGVLSYMSQDHFLQTITVPTLAAEGE